MKKIAYSADCKSAAKETGLGMFTVSVVRPDGSRIDVQRAFRSEGEMRLLWWTTAALEAEECASVDMERLVTEAAQQATKSAVASTAEAEPR